MTVNQFIKFLTALKANGQLKGTEKVYLSADEEGNSFALFDGGDGSIGIENGILTIYPTGESVMAEDLF